MTDQVNKHYKLKLQFDGDQISDVLLYEFKHNGHNAMTKEGRYSGCVQFEKGDTIEVEVTMTAVAKEKATVERMQVISLDLVSQPNVTHQIDSFSPFTSDEVTKSLVGNWSIPKEEIDPANGAKRWVSKWEGESLSVTADKGYWQLSGFLGVAVYQTMGTAPIRIPRVLSFDPETSTGEGGNPDE